MEQNDLSLSRPSTLHYSSEIHPYVSEFEYLCPNLSNGRTYLRGVTTLTSILKFSQNLNRHEVDSSSTTSFDIYLPYVFISIAHGEVLRQTHERIIDRRVAVRMIAAQHVADAGRGLFERLVLRRCR